MTNHSNKISIRPVENSDKPFWFSLDKHLSEVEFCGKVNDGRGYVMLFGDIPIGILRYNLFWDNTPFCNLLVISENYRGRGFGSNFMAFWETEMQKLGFSWILVSTRSDESALQFYRKIGYTDCGNLLAPDQPPEIFLRKIF